MPALARDIEIMPGIRRVARRTADGEWLVPDVPYVATAVDSRDPEDVLVIDREWLEGALAEAKAEERSGYLPPLHFQHHSRRDRVEFAGHFRLKDIRRITVKGEEVDAIFADEIYPSEAALEMAASHPYRSVEVVGDRGAYVDSCALLSDRPPFFKFGRMVIVRREPTEFSKQGRDASRARAFHFDFSGAREMQQNDKKTMQDEPTDAPAAGDARPAWVDDILGMLAAVLDAVSALGKPAERTDDEAPAEMMGKPKSYAAHDEPTEPAAEPTDDKREGELDGMRREFARARAELDELKRENALNKRVSELHAKGFPADVVRKFEARAAEKGIERANDWLEGVALTTPADPPRAHEFLGGSSGSAPATTRYDDDPAEVKAFASHGPAVLDRARELAASHKRVGSPLPLKRWLDINMDTGDFLAKTRSAHTGRA